MLKNQSKISDTEFIEKARKVLNRDYEKSEEEILALTGKKLAWYWYLCHNEQSAKRTWQLRKKIEEGMPFTIGKINNKYIRIEAR